jgi:hypothetical protein
MSLDRDEKFGVAFIGAGCLLTVLFYAVIIALVAAAVIFVANRI